MSDLSTEMRAFIPAISRDCRIARSDQASWSRVNKTCRVRGLQQRCDREETMPPNRKGEANLGGDRGGYGHIIEARV